ncbi:hypothetical protein [Roseomonas sp. KE0001]|nr:hypothetical protein [Roseomonas sp. KE0001]
MGRYLVALQIKPVAKTLQERLEIHGLAASQEDEILLCLTQQCRQRLTA